MTEEERMQHVDVIIKAATAVGFECRKHFVRSLAHCQILENGQWILFDPVHRGKDISKLMYQAARKSGNFMDEVSFRVAIINEISSNDYSVS